MSVSFILALLFHPSFGTLLLHDNFSQWDTYFMDLIFLASTKFRHVEELPPVNLVFILTNWVIIVFTVIFNSLLPTSCHILVYPILFSPLAYS